jgi:sigma-E factor negative regulatory protein RseA
MTDEIREQISVFIDDELSAEECEFFVRRLQRDSTSRAHYIKYQLIGAAIRGELGQPNRSLELRGRVQAALGGGTATAASSARRSNMRALVKPLLGFGIAASVTVAALLALRISNGVSQTSGFEPAAVTADSRLEMLEKPSYVVPMQVPEPRLVTPPIQLTKYLMQHGGYASPLNRTSVHSNVVSGPAEVEDPNE